MTNNVRMFFEEGRAALSRLAELAVPHAELTLIMRVPGDNECEILITNDDIDALVALLERSRARTPVTQEGGE